MVEAKFDLRPRPIKDFFTVAKIAVKYAFWGAVVYFGLKTAGCIDKKAEAAEQLKPTTAQVYIDNDYINRKVELNKQYGIPGKLEQIAKTDVK
jgi:hypothetical protein